MTRNRSALLAGSALAGLMAIATLNPTSAFDAGLTASPTANAVGPTAGGSLTARPIGTEAPKNGGRILFSSVLPNVQASVIGPNQAQQASIALNPNHPALWMSGAQDSNCGTAQGFYFSTDGGSTWAGSCLPLAPGASSGGGATILGWAPTDLSTFAYAGGLDFYSNGNAEVVVAHSTDKGRTWSTPIVAAGAAPDSFMDRPWLEVDQNPASPRKGAVYISATKFNQSNSAQQITVSHSTDRGKTWTQVAVDDVQNTSLKVDGFSNLAIASNGVVYVSWMRCNITGGGTCGGSTATMYLSKSKDGGNTWSPAQSVHNVHLAPACAFYGCLPNTSLQVGNIPVIAVDTSGTSTNGRLYLTDYAWVNNHMKVFVVASGNGGATWGPRVSVSGSNHDQFFPWINVSDGGVVGVTWLDRREDPANHNYDAFAATSNDGGTTFTPGVRLSSVSSSPGNAIYDYASNAWTKGSRQKLVAAWTDTRSGTQQTEVGGLRP